MSAADNGTPFTYTVEISGLIKAEIKALAAQAAAIGQKQQYLDAWRQIDKRLRGDPLQFGECRYHMAKGEFRCHIAVIQPVAVGFAIHEKKHKVVLLRVSLLGS
jgi:hypothetical protein